MKQKISAQLAAGFAFIVLITVAVISVTANGLISRQFEAVCGAAAENVIGAAGPVLILSVSCGRWNLECRLYPWSWHVCPERRVSDPAGVTQRVR